MIHKNHLSIFTWLGKHFTRISHCEKTAYFVFISEANNIISANSTHIRIQGLQKPRIFFQMFILLLTSFFLYHFCATTSTIILS